MRASATSRFSPPVGISAARADTNTPKANEASPFALLIDAAAPPTQKSSNSSGGQKKDDQPDSGKTTDQAVATQSSSTQAQHSRPQTSPATSSSDNQQPPQAANDGGEDAGLTDAATADDVQQQDATAVLAAATPSPGPSDTGTADRADANNIALWPQSAKPASSSGQTGKPVKADKTDKSDKKDAAPTLAPDPEAIVTAAVPVPQAPVPVTAGVADEMDIAGTPAIPAIAAPASQPATLQAVDQTADAAPPQPAEQTKTQSGGQIASQAADQAIATSAPQTTPSKPIAQSQDEPVQRAAAPVKAEPALPGANAGGKTAKTDTAKLQQTGDPADVKSADAAQPGEDAVRPAPPDAAASRLAGTISILPGQPAALQAQGPAITQHIQVTQPHDLPPNLPALAVEIAAKSLGGAKQFDIRLDPPELGRVEVRLSIDATGKASAHLSADQPQTLSLLQKDAQGLTRALRDAGLDVSQDGLNFSLRQQTGQDGGASAHSGRGQGRGFALAAASSIEATSTSAAYSAPADGRLDIRV